MNTSAKYLLDTLTTFKQTYPGILEFVDSSRKRDLLKCKSWPDYVYYPREKLHYALQRTQTNYYALSSDKAIEGRVSTIYNIGEIAHMLYNWRRTKKIYKFSQELTDILLSQADATDAHSMQLPTELLTSLPHECFFIEADFCKDTFGCMIMLDYYEKDNLTVLQAFNINRMYLQDKYSKNVGVPECTELTLIPGKTIGECMDHDTKKILSIYNRKEINFTFNRQKADRHQMRLITFLLYLLSQNADIQKDPDQSKIYRERLPLSPIRDKLREIEIMNVGFGINTNCGDREWNCSVEGNKPILNWVHKSKIDERDQQISILEKTIEGLRKEISTLKAEVYESDRRSKNAEKALNQLRLDTENDRRELADLREYIFNIQNPEYINEDEDPSIELPYITDRRITIFGGHSSWVKKIKPMLPSVRFVDTCTASSISDSIIKNSDIIWIQNNSISHSKYYQIINIARTYNIPTRYFSYASSRKCAEQLVKDDLSRS